MEWRLFPENGSAEEWDRDLAACAEPAVYQTHAWGESQRAAGWSPARWRAVADGNALALAQILTKRLPFGIKIYWFPGGPMFHAGCAENPPLELLASLTACLAPRREPAFLRLDSHLMRTPERALLFSRVWQRPRRLLNSPCSLRIDLRQSMSAIEAAFSHHHRRNLKAASRAGLTFTAGNDASMIGGLIRLHREMLALKRDPSIRIDLRKIPAACHALGANAVIAAACRDGQALASCLLLLCGKRAFYRAAAAGREGRICKAAFYLIRNLLPHLQALGCEWFDFGGLDPNLPDGWQGVNFFKMGFGGERVEYLGEWEWSNRGWLRAAVNGAIALERWRPRWQ